MENLLLFPRIGRLQSVVSVRKLVTAKYAYLVYYTVDEPADEIVVLAVKHPSRQRDYEDA